ncbi:SRPBCC domain-containing protein [bacterium]|nr:SRPBCC domain-containing protein [bacterium]
MKQIFTGIEINAPVEKVWAVLTNFEEYPKWNPFIKLVDGEIKEGSVFKVTLEQPDSKPMVFKPKCLKFEKNKEFKWLGHLYIPGIFDGEHSFELIEMGEKKTNFIQKEIFKGLLVPFLWKQLNTKTRKGFKLMNEKLKELSETK